MMETKKRPRIRNSDDTFLARAMLAHLRGDDVAAERWARRVDGGSLRDWEPSVEVDLDEQDELGTGERE